MNLIHQVLLRLMRPQYGDEDRQFVREASKNIDGEELLLLATRGGVAGFVASHLDDLQLSLDTKAKFFALAIRTERQNKIMIEEAASLCAVATADGLTLVPFKGAALNMNRPYNNLSLRSMCDIDLLTKPEEWQQLVQWLAAHQYQSLRPHHGKYRLEYGCEFKKTTPDGVFILELHWSPYLMIFRDLPLAADAIAAASLIEYGQYKVKQLSAEETWLICVCHLAKHFGQPSLKWLLDAAAVANKYQSTLSWPTIWKRAKRLGAYRAAFVTAKLIRENFGVPIELPDDEPMFTNILARLQPIEFFVESALIDNFLRRQLIYLFLLDTPIQAAQKFIDKAHDRLKMIAGDGVKSVK